MGMKDEDIIKEFKEQIEQEYVEILAELKKEQIDLVSLSKKYQQIKIKDYFESELG
ncbi:hypothetical protein ACIQZD_11480 [Peribacillus sp. NPDC096447]|uniref:hypothetical protein n=1 Tax=Peribacillus sp. NPDC096447 TaxID=3364394 RepID=UPI0037F6B564